MHSFKDFQKYPNKKISIKKTGLTNQKPNLFIKNKESRKLSSKGLTKYTTKDRKESPSALFKWND